MPATTLEGFLLSDVICPDRGSCSLLGEIVDNDVDKGPTKQEPNTSLKPAY